MKPRVLLVYPGRRSGLFPELPLPLLYLAWALRKEGIEVDVHDMRILDNADITRTDYLFVGISIMTGPMISDALACAARVRQINPRTPIVWGGIHVTLLPEQSLQHSLVDIVVRGEGEHTVQELAHALLQGTDLSSVKGLNFKRDGMMIATPDREFMSLDEIDIELPYDLFVLDRYAFPAFPVHTSRGCPYRCGFCYNTAFNKRTWRYKSVEHVLDEIEYVVRRFNPRRVSFTWEDEFFINIERIRNICEGIARRGIKIEWESFCRFDSFRKVDDDLLALLERSGCVCLSFGGESGSQRILDEIIRKDIKVEYMVDATRRLSSTRVRQIVSFMSGLPTETDEDMSKTFALMDTLVSINPRIYFNGIFLYTPYPGTVLYDRVVSEFHYRPPQSLEEWATFGIYRNVGATWQTPAYIRKYKTVSIMTRFPFWRQRMTLADARDAVGASRLARFPFNIAYLIFSWLAILRWRRRFFRFPIEWILLEKLLERLRGFI